jgi:hypothetical protein
MHVKMHFNRGKVETLLDHAEKAREYRTPYGEGSTGAGLLLVGDQGVYLMSNGLPRMPIDDTDRHVCFARECNPRIMAFDDWWQAKRQSFGGDDGVESFTAADVRSALATYRPGEDLILDVAPDAVGLVGYRTVTRPAPRKPRAKAKPQHGAAPSKPA